MRAFKKFEFPVSEVRRFLEPGPVVLVSSSYKNKMNIMTMGWYMVLWEEPSLLACMIWDQNYSHELIKKSKECVINLPTVELAEKVVRVGNVSGKEIDKFDKFDLTPVPGEKVKAPLIKECYANFECRLFDSQLIKRYNLFIFEVIKAQAAKTPKNPKTIHYRGQGEFMISGPTTAKFRKWFRPEYL